MINYKIFKLHGVFIVYKNIQNSSSSSFAAAKLQGCDAFYFFIYERWDTLLCTDPLLIWIKIYVWLPLKIYNILYNIKYGCSSTPCCHVCLWSIQRNNRYLVRHKLNKCRIHAVHLRDITSWAALDKIDLHWLFDDYINFFFIINFFYTYFMHFNFPKIVFLF